MEFKKLSIIIPSYNEAATLPEIISRVEAVDLGVAKEIIIVDDGSSDGTEKLLANYVDKYKIIRHENNQGKGAAVRSGIAVATGDYIVIQDADLEYDPEDIKKMVVAANEGAEVIYGSRRLGLVRKKNVKAGWLYYIGGVMLTTVANLLYGINITDEPTGYKMVKKEVLAKLNLKCEGFEFCPEITAKIARLKIPIKEVPISYQPRSKMQGKKIKFKDAIIAVWTLLKYRL